MDLELDRKSVKKNTRPEIGKIFGKENMIIYSIIDHMNILETGEKC